MYHVTRAGIDMSALQKNYNTIRAHVDKKDKSVRMICVVKADAYGHGVKRCAEVFLRSGARDFAVSNLDEALELRSYVGDEPTVLILGYTNPEYAQVLRENRLTQTVYSLDYARALAENLSGKLDIHIKVDTGMNRLGFSADEAGVDDACAALSLGCFNAGGIFTHFADADGAGSENTYRQFELFTDFISGMQKRGYTFETRHCCNSAATVRYPEMYLDAVRCGIILYGLDPSGEVHLDGLCPVMSLRSRISHIHTVKAGEKISYGGTFSPESDILVATVPIGYDDGFLRAYSSNGVYINGKFAKILGRICMDQCMVNVTDIDCAPGDAVEIFGEHQSVDTLAENAGTINYEVTCMVGKRVPRDEIN